MIGKADIKENLRLGYAKYESQMANGFGEEFVARAPKAYLHTTRGSERQKQTKLKRKGRKACGLFNLK